MKQLFRPALFLFLLSMSCGSFAETVTVTCSHSELCQLAKRITEEHKLTQFSFRTLVTMTGDPHEFEPTAGELKSLINAPLLIAGPHELNPWIKKVNYQRAKNPAKKTLTLELLKKHSDLYQAGNTHSSKEALSHFWLYPKIYCTFRDELEQKMIEANLLQKTVKSSCAAVADRAENDLRLSMQKLTLPVILTHDALLPLLNALKTAKVTVIAIKGSGHHEETSSSSVKKLYDVLKYPKAIWIEESGIHIPANILNRKRQGDVVIKIDTAKDTGNGPFSTLLQLSSELSKNQK